jgi:NAD(P)H dehydrogenase (quinone)
MRIFILLGHPNKDTLTGHFADIYEREARMAGHEVRRMNISDMQFDPILHQGYKVIQELEPDLCSVQENMKWAEHFVLLYPLWWSAMPALLKGMWDRMFLPGFAFCFHKGGRGLIDLGGWDKLLKGRTARLIVPSKSPGWMIAFLFGDFMNEVERSILGFAGYKVRLTSVGNAETFTPSQVARWDTRIAVLARKGA